MKDIFFSTLIIDRTHPGAKEKLIKLSFRSQGGFDVNKLPKKHFNGGGHKSAAGGQTATTLEETVEQFLSILPEYGSELTELG